MEERIAELELTISKLKEENKDLKEHLSKYTAPKRNLNYYERNKEKISNQKKEYYRLRKEGK